jgi:hypothetical protein
MKLALRAGVGVPRRRPISLAMRELQCRKPPEPADSCMFPADGLSQNDFASQKIRSILVAVTNL